MKSLLNNATSYTFILCASLCMLTSSYGQSKFDVDEFIKSAAKVDKSDLGDGMIEKKYTSKSGSHLTVWLDKDSNPIPRMKRAAYVFVVPGPKSFFLRKAWLSKTGHIIQEERRAYDANSRLVMEGYVDPKTGAFTTEFRHRYSKDGKTQYTIEFLNGVQKGKEMSHTLEK
ncbi:hypothetical protein N9283_04980 [Akkermansiaceae bacterium]|nr:hypothetical protein [Akkermansiaceae bacterium]